MHYYSKYGCQEFHVLCAFTNVLGKRNKNMGVLHTHYRLSKGSITVTVIKATKMLSVDYIYTRYCPVFFTYLTHLLSLNLCEFNIVVCVSQGFPKKQNQQALCMYMHLCTYVKRLVMRIDSRGRWSWELRSAMICLLQAGATAELVV